MCLDVPMPIYRSVVGNAVANMHCQMKIAFISDVYVTETVQITCTKFLQLDVCQICNLHCDAASAQEGAGRCKDLEHLGDDKTNRNK